MALTEEITNQYSWLNKMLFERILCRSRPMLRVDEFDVEPAFGNGENYSSNLIRVNVKYFHENAIHRKQFMVKATLGEKLVRSRNVFAKEICIYDEIVPRFETILKAASISIKLTPKYDLSIDCRLDGHS